MSENPDEVGVGTSLVPKREDEAEDNDADNRLARAPDLNPVVHKLFLSPNQESIFDNTQFSRAEMQLDKLEKSLSNLRELQDDGREYVERLEESGKDWGTRGHKGTGFGNWYGGRRYKNYRRWRLPPPSECLECEMAEPSLASVDRAIL